jgi:hypothetical protein
MLLSDRGISCLFYLNIIKSRQYIHVDMTCDSLCNYTIHVRHVHCIKDDAAHRRRK